MVKTRKRILSVTVRRPVDTDPDFSCLGEYTSEPGPADRTIDRAERGDQLSREYRYFVAAMSGEETGNPESVEQDYQRMEDYNRCEWCYVGLYVEARVQIASDVVQTIRSGGLWGIESDSDSAHFAEVTGEELDTLRGELAALGFSKRQIDKAFAEKTERE